MFLGKVIGNAVPLDEQSTVQGRKLLMVQKLDLYRNPTGTATMAIDFVGAGDGDIVMVGAAPGHATVSAESLGTQNGELIMGILNLVDPQGKPAPAMNAASSA
jgi:ethanolamine utilization protein EutN